MPSTRAGRKWRWNAVTTSRGGDVVAPVAVDAVAVARQPLLQFGDRVAGVVGLEPAAVRSIGAGIDPETDAGLRQQLPGKFLAGILLAAGATSECATMFSGG